jgi:hypothetical protein
VLGIGGTANEADPFHNKLIRDRSNSFSFLHLPVEQLCYGKLSSKQYSTDAIFQMLSGCLGHAAFKASTVGGDGNKLTPLVFEKFQIIPSLNQNNEHQVHK